jgi:hypothetical protein
MSSNKYDFFIGESFINSKLLNVGSSSIDRYDINNVSSINNSGAGIRFFQQNIDVNSLNVNDFLSDKKYVFIDPQGIGYIQNINGVLVVLFY